MALVNPVMPGSDLYIRVSREEFEILQLCLSFAKENRHLLTGSVVEFKDERVRQRFERIEQHQYDVIQSLWSTFAPYFLHDHDSSVDTAVSV